MSTSPRQAIASPPAANQREPMRSASEPLSGAMTAIVKGNGVNSKPASSLENPRSSSRQKGNMKLTAKRARKDRRRVTMAARKTRRFNNEKDKTGSETRS